MSYLLFALAVGFSCGVGWLAGAQQAAFRLRRVMIEHRENFDRAQLQTAEAVAVGQGLREMLEPMERALVEERRKSAAYFETIESTIRQRQNWENLYNKQAAEHGNAQALMMNRIEHYVARLQRLGHTAEVPAVLREVQQLYQDGHLNSVSDRVHAPMVEPFSNPSRTLSEGIEKPSRTLTLSAENQVAETTPKAES